MQRDHLKPHRQRVRDFLGWNASEEAAVLDAGLVRRYDYDRVIQMNPATEDFAAVADFVNWWLITGQVSARFRWPWYKDDGAAMELASDSLFGAIGQQIAARVLGSAQLFCVNCGGALARAVGPKGGAPRRYCDGCRAEGAPAKRKEANRGPRVRGKRARATPQSSSRKSR